MDAVAIVIPIFALILIGLVATLVGFLPAGSVKSISAFAFGICVPALLFRTIATADFPAISPLHVWGAFFGAIAITWVIACLVTATVLRRPAWDGVAVAMASTYGNVVMLGIPLSLSVIGPDAASPMALILAVHTPALWLVASLQMGWAERKRGTSVTRLLSTLARDLARNPIVLGILGGFVLRLTGLGLPAVADKTLVLLAQAGVPAALVALGASLSTFRIKGQVPTLATMCVLKLAVMPLLAWWLATEVFALPPAAAGVVIIFAAMPSGANVFLFVSRYRHAVNSSSGAVALGTLLSVLTTSVLVGVVLRATG